MARMPGGVFVKVTVCQFPEDQERLAAHWRALAEHVMAEAADLVLLPEMPFSPWMARSPHVDPRIWAEAVAAHERWTARLGELGARVVAGTSPILEGGIPYNQAFVWTEAEGCRPVHKKVFLPEEEGFWEARWYRPGEPSFAVAESPLGRLGFLICTELWFGEWARFYGRQGVRFLLCPRATAMGSRDKWIAGGRTAAVMSGAFCLSSNRGGVDRHACSWAGTGWIIEPEEGDVLALTGAASPFITLDLDETVADRAKTTYPRYVRES